MKKILKFITLLFTVNIGFSQSFNVSGVTYEVISGTTNQVKAKSYTASSGTSVNLPKTVVNPLTNTKLSVTEIENFAFNNKGLTSVTLPEGLLKIGNEAFSTNSITNLVIPNSVTEIGYNAFKNNLIASLDLGTGITTIGNTAFNTNKIVAVTLPSSLQTMGSWTFENNLIKKVTVKSGVGQLGTNVFNNNPMKVVVCEGMIPSSIVSSGFGSIANRNTIDLYIPTGTKGVYFTNAGAEWTGFKSVAEEKDVIGYITYEVTSTAPNTVKAINYNYIDGGSMVTIPTAVTLSSVVYSVTEIGTDAFNTKGLTSLTLSQGLKTINTKAFWGNNITGSLVIPNSVTTIGANSFYGNKITNLTVGSGVTFINTQAFANNLLTQLTIPSNVQTLGGAVFGGNNISSITIKNGAGNLGARTFFDNPLTTITSESMVPPTIITGGNDDTYNKTGNPTADRATIDLIIPTGTLGTYVSNAGALWTGFKTVSEEPTLKIKSENFYNSQSINVYPNPVTSILNFDVSEEITFIEILNLNGISVTTKNRINNSLDVSNLQEGIYILKLTLGNKVAIKKFVKN